VKKARFVSKRQTLLGGTAAGVLAIGLAAGPAVFAQDPGVQAEPATITMAQKGKKLVFEGPDTVQTGQPLKIVNDTSARKVGPHTLSLVAPGLLPTTAKQFKNCFTPKKLCMRIALAHKFNPKTEKIGQQLVDPGAKGWSKAFTKKAKGDSWYTETKGESFTANVSASAGKTLSFLCAVHPDMQGEIEVVAAP
jgi:hypothetical protein